MPMTEHFTRQSSCTFHSRKMGRIAKIQSLMIETTATAYESVVWMLRSSQNPSIVVNQFFLGDVRTPSTWIFIVEATYCTG